MSKERSVKKTHQPAGAGGWLRWPWAQHCGAVGHKVPGQTVAQSATAAFTWEARGCLGLQKHSLRLCSPSSHGDAVATAGTNTPSTDPARAGGVPGGNGKRQSCSWEPRSSFPHPTTAAAPQSISGSPFSILMNRKGSWDPLRQRPQRLDPPKE